MGTPHLTRTIVAAVSLFLPAAAIAVSWLAWQSDLPARIASHWSGSGAADASVPTVGVLVVTLVISILAAGLGAIVLLRTASRMSRFTIFWLGMVTGVTASLWLIPAWLTLQAGSAENAVLGAWGFALVAFLLYGVVPYAIAPRGIPAKTMVSGSTFTGSTFTGSMVAGSPVAGSPDTETLVERTPVTEAHWTRTVTAFIFLWASVLIAGVALVIYGPMMFDGRAGTGLIGLIIMAVVVVLLLGLMRLRVTIDSDGFTVKSTLLGIAIKRIRLHKIRVVESAELRPRQWGGWGYRITPGASAIILRAGPGIVITTITDTQFAMTLDDSDHAAAILQALADRAALQT